MNKIIIIIYLIGYFNIAFCQTTNKIDTCLLNTDVFLYLHVDELPVFQYQDMNVIEYIYTNLKWPDEFDGQGKIVVSFIVTECGKVCNVKIEKQLCDECDNEVKRVLNSMPNWEAGKIENKPVDVLLFLPIYFRLSYPNKQELKQEFVPFKI